MNILIPNRMLSAFARPNVLARTYSTPLASKQRQITWWTPSHLLEPNLPSRTIVDHPWRVERSVWPRCMLCIKKELRDREVVRNVHVKMRAMELGHDSSVVRREDACDLFVEGWESTQEVRYL